MRRSLVTISNWLFSLLVGLTSFAFTLAGFLMLREFGEQVLAAISIGMFGLAVVWIALERPNSDQGRAMKALVDRLSAVEQGDLATPAPAIVRQQMPILAAAIDRLFVQVRANLDNVTAMALRDPVTELPNRLHFKREAERLLALAPGPMALLFVDLDGFKEVNDGLGHAHGDKVLTLIAHRLQVVMEAGTSPGGIAPLLARLAGDEFTLLIPGIADPRDARRIAAALLRAIGVPVEVGGRRLQLGASIGIALTPGDASDLAGLMRAADIAMYHAKASPHDKACFYRPELAAAFAGRADVANGVLEPLLLPRTA